jgi:hypothetical protein
MKRLLLETHGGNESVATHDSGASQDADAGPSQPVFTPFGFLHVFAKFSEMAVP